VPNVQGVRGTMAGKRIQIDLQDKSLERLEKLKELTESTSYAEVFKNSLRLYEFIIELEQSGKKLVIKADDGFTPISLLLN
jgi:hypothetical protein